MVDYPDMSNLNATSGIGGILALPNASYPYFWTWILFGIWMIITTSLYFSEKERKGKGNLLSSMSVSSLAIIILSSLGTIIGFIEVSVMVQSLIFNLVIISLWIFSEN